MTIFGKSHTPLSWGRAAKACERLPVPEATLTSREDAWRAGRAPLGFHLKHEKKEKSKIESSLQKSTKMIKD